jgi:1-acyl-sn-glycerol-3-phosphate acyltransferase
MQVRRGFVQRLASAVRVFLSTLSSYALGYPLTTLLILSCIVADLVNARGYIRRCVAFWGRLVFWLAGRRVHVQGREHRVEGRAYLVLTNHSSMYDIPALLAVVPDVALVGREKLTRIPVFRRLLKIIHYVPINTEEIRKARGAISEAVRRAEEGYSIGMFPEGTRTLDGRVQKLKRGFVYVLRESRLDVLPVTIRGTFAFKPKGRFTVDPRDRIEVKVHPPMEIDRLVRFTDNEIMERVHAVFDGGVHGAQ